MRDKEKLNWLLSVSINKNYVPKLCVKTFSSLGAGDMNVYIQDPSSGSQNKQFTSSGDRGSMWHEIQVTINSAIEHQVVIEVVEGQNTNATVAVDDVMFETTICKGTCNVTFASGIKNIIWFYLLLKRRIWNAFSYCTAKNGILEISKTSYFEKILIVSLPRKSCLGVTQEILSLISRIPFLAVWAISSW